MGKKIILFIIIAFAVKAMTFGQQTTTAPGKLPDLGDYNKYSLPSVSAGAGIMTFFGDIGNIDCKVTHVGKFNAASSFTVEQRIGSALGISLGATKGSLCDNDNRAFRHLNFQTDVMQGNLGITFHFDNDFIINKTSRFAPFITVGFGYMTFEARGDLKDKNGVLYNYWPDGTIRDQAFDWENPQNGNIIVRDYSYETKLDPLNQYTHHSLMIPVGGGLNFKFSDRFEANISTYYYFTKTDAIDNLAYQKIDKFKFFSPHSDAYLYTSVSLQFNIGGKSKAQLGNKYYKDVNFKKLSETDTDGDGIPDFLDKCPDTPKGIAVDNDGCPIDSDHDGVPDYKDKEPNTAAGAIVDTNGVTLTPEMIEAEYTRDSLIIAGEIVLDKDTSMTTSDIDANVIHAYLHYNKNQHQHQNEYNNNTINEINSPQGGVVYRTQIGALADGNSKSFFQKNYNITEEIYVDVYQGTYKYSIGTFYTYKEARAYANSIKARTGINSFVIAYKNGSRIPVSDAKTFTGE
jgi:hypothetical protein